MSNNPTDVSFDQRPSDNPDLFLFGWDPGNTVLAGANNSIIDSRRCTVINGQNNSIGSEGRQNGKYNSHIIGNNKNATQSNKFYIACINGLSCTGPIQTKNSSSVSIGSNAIIGGNVNVSGDITSFSLSDINLKSKIKKVKECLNKISMIDAVSFCWNDKQSTMHGADIGLIAQQVDCILSEAVKENKNKYLSLNYKKIIPLLVACIKEKQEKINKLRLKIQQIQ